MSDAQAEALASALAANSTLITLDMTYIKPTLSRATAVLGALCSNSTLQKFRW